MQADETKHNLLVHAKRPGSTSGLEPLDRILAEHAVQLELCDALEHIADGLPNRFERKLLREVINVLAHGMAGHFAFEENGLFPLLRRRAVGDASLVAALEQLEVEHGRDVDLCGELAEELRLYLLREQARNPEMLAFMLRGFFEGQRRHIEWENTVVLPAARRLLTVHDLDALAPGSAGHSERLAISYRLRPRKTEARRR